MDRRTFITATGAATLATAATAGSISKGVHADAYAIDRTPTIKSGSQELRVAIFSPDGVSGESDIARQLFVDIAVASEGRFHFELIKATGGSIDALAQGDVDIHFGAENFNTKHDVSTSFFAGLPWHSGLTPTGYESWLESASGQDLWDLLMEPYGMKPLLAGHLGSDPGLWSRVRLADIEDMSGVRIGVRGLASQVVRGLGAKPVDYECGKEASMLKEQHVDAIEVGGLEFAMTAHVHKTAKYLVMPGFHPKRSEFDARLTTLCMGALQ